jgi:dTDP-4-amino-4,6-dideoxygalactose transaminase
MEIARRHNVKVIEDVSHAQGGFYKGRKLGTIGDVAAMSMMSGKSFAIGEAGMLCTDNQEIYERAVAFGHYEQTATKLTLPDLQPWIGIPVGAYKNRLNQLNSAMGRVQLKLYPTKIQEIQDAMNYFWDELEGLPGIRAHRPPKDSGSTMAGWYAATGLYVADELGGLPIAKFREAVSAEGARCGRGCNNPLHLHYVLNEADLYGDGKPTRNAFTDRDVRQPPGSLPVTEALPDRCYSIPWFKHDRREEIDLYVAAFRKVIEQADQLL